jgi:hypothetical protein
MAPAKTWRSPEKSAVIEGLSTMRTPTYQDLAAAMDAGLHCQIVWVPQDYMTDPERTVNSWKPDMSRDSQRGILELQHHKGILGAGSFKTCHLARVTLSSEPINDEAVAWRINEPVMVAAKRFYMHTGAKHPPVVQFPRFKVYTEVDQVLVEGNTMYWAYGLQGVVEAFMQREESRTTRSSPPIAPLLR